MRALHFLPFTFLAGVHGFGLFAPYVALVFATVPLIRLAQRLRDAYVARANAPANGPAFGLPTCAPLNIQ